MERKKKSELTLARPTRQSPIALFTKLSGRAPTPEELEEAKPLRSLLKHHVRHVGLWR
jgi:hypothetical protein